MSDQKTNVAEFVSELLAGELGGLSNSLVVGTFDAGK